MTDAQNRRRLQWALGAMAAIPAASSVGEIARGAQGVPGGSAEVTPTVDSSLRYANVFKLGWSFAIWSQLSRAERSPVVTWSLATLFVGGLARIRSWQQQGRPHPVAVAATALELVAPPVLIAWQRHVASRRR
jgi:hypothetical protein